MCNLYALTRSADEMRRVFRSDRDLTGNLPSLPSFPSASELPRLLGHPENEGPSTRRPDLASGQSSRFAPIG
jgi:hypothetical protein